MSTPMLARIILGVLALEIGICAIFLADEWPPLKDIEERVFSSFLRASSKSKNYIVEPTDTHARQRVVRPLTPGKALPYLRIEVDQDINSTLSKDGTAGENQIFSSYPLAPLDWAVIINNAHKAGCGILAVDTPLSWEDKNEIDLTPLNDTISKFNRSILTVDLNLGPDTVGSARNAPLYLSRNAIPKKQVFGNAGNVTQVNRVALPPSATGNEDTLFSFRFVQNPDEIPNDSRLDYFAMPAIAKWGDVYIPSFPLALVMARYRTNPAQVTITLGQHIRVGDGPLIPIDEFGNFRLPLQPRVVDLSSMQVADQVANAAHLGTDLSFDENTVALFADRTSGGRSPWRSPSHLQKIFNSLDALPQPSEPHVHPRLPAWGELIFLGVVACIAALLLRLPVISRVASYSLLIFAALGLLAILLKVTDTWIQVLPVIATALAGLLFSIHLSEYAPVPTILADHDPADTDSDSDIENPRSEAIN